MSNTTLTGLLGGWPYISLGFGGFVAWIVGNVILTRLTYPTRRTGHLHRAFAILQLVYLVIVLINLVNLWDIALDDQSVTRTGFLPFWAMINEGLRVVVLLSLAGVTLFLTLSFRSFSGFWSSAALLGLLFATSMLERWFAQPAFVQIFA